MTDLFKPDLAYIEHKAIRDTVKACLGGKAGVLKIVSDLPGPLFVPHIINSDMPAARRAIAERSNLLNNKKIAAHWSRGRFFNAVGRTHESLGGMVYSKPPEKDIAPALSYIEEDATGTGINFDQLIQKAVDQTVAYGRYGVLVDMPESESGLTQADMRQASKAAKCITYEADNILWVRVGTDGRSVDEIRLLEFDEVQKNEFEWETEKFVRRLVIKDGVYHNERYNEKSQLVSSFQPRANGQLLDKIPFVFFGSESNTPDYSKVPLYDLADTNLGHFALDCDDSTNLYYNLHGIKFIFTDLDGDSLLDKNPNGLNVEADGVNVLDQGDSFQMEQLEANGAGAAKLKVFVDNMVMLGAQLVQDSSSNTTLGAKQMEFGASTSTLKRVSYNCSDGAEKLLEYLSLFMGVTQESTYKLNTDFVTDEMTYQMIQQVFQMVQAGTLPQDVLFSAARKAGLTKDDDETLKEKLSDQDLLMGGESEELATLRAQLEANNAE